MAASTQREDGTRSIRPLAIGYLVWHCVSSIALVALLVLCTMAYAGAFPSVTELSSDVSVFGAIISVWVIIVAAWVIVCAVSVTGVLFGVGALLIGSTRSRSEVTLQLARVMIVVCVLDVLLSLFQQNVISVLASVVSLALTIALSLEIRRARPLVEADGHDVRGGGGHGLASEAVEALPAQEDALDPELRGIFRLVRGYTTIMLIWGALRTLSGLSALFSVGIGQQGVLDVPSLLAGILVALSGVYLFVVGRLGHSALAGGLRLHSFFIAGIVGLSLSVLMLVAALVAGGLGAVSLLHGTSTVVFCLALDCVLYATGCAYAHKLHRQLPCELCDLGAGENFRK